MAKVPCAYSPMLYSQEAPRPVAGTNIHANFAIIYKDAALMSLIFAKS